MHKLIERVVLLLALGGFVLLAPSGSAAARLVGKPAPELHNDTWIHSPPLRLRDLRGKVVLLEFWTYG